MSLAKYEIFKVVVKLGNLTKAAEKLNLTQSSISYAISTLESEFGFPLINRSRSRIDLTCYGERVFPHIERVLQAEALLREEVNTIKNGAADTVRVGTISSVSIQWLPGILAEINRTYPNIKIKTYLGCYDEMNEWISNGTIDFGFVSLPTSKPFDVMPLAKDKLVVLLPPGHPLRNKRVISFEQIRNESFIMPQWGNDDNIKRIVLEHDLGLQVKYEIMEERTIFAMVQRGMGISILPELILVDVPKDILIVDLDKPAYRTIGIAAKSFAGLPMAARKFIACVKSWLDSRGFLDFK